ncbi:hypothetical protein [Maribacter halichondriae]|uniref:hypothetical protein n=1 Tax=Maribacter halichondriae TaxID=2980554 RepID=UPI002358C5F9|nr:hypothetical protein [Maribacter sp. Hal144]
MTVITSYSEFLGTLEAAVPSGNWPEALKALWYDAKGDWEGSHDIAQEMHNEMGSWIHAYLHRKEGDEFNAGYWYRRAGRPFPQKTLKAEHRDLVEFILKR